MERIATSKPKVIAAIVVLLLLLGAVVVIAWNVLAGPGHSTRQVHVDPAKTAASGNNFDPNRPPPVPAKPESEWLSKFNSVYALAPGETVKFIPKPFIPERLEFYRARMGGYQVQAIPDGPDFYVLADSGNQQLRMQMAIFGQVGLAHMIQAALNLRDWEFVAPPFLQHDLLKGDIVIRNASTAEQNAGPLAAAISQRLRRTITIQPKQMEVTTLIMGGRVAYRGPATSRTTSTTGPASAGITKNPTTPYIRVGLFDSQPDDYTYVNQPIGSFARRLEQFLQMRVKLDGLPENTRISWRFDRSIYRMRAEGVPDKDAIDKILVGIEAQSELTFKQESTTSTVWVLTDGVPATSQPANVPTSSPTSLPATTAPLR